MYKSKRGITLIALVVTIIVLLILAGISISMLTGNKGIIQQSTKAKTQTDIAGEKEILDLAIVYAMEKSKYGDIDETSFTNELEKNNAIVTKSGNNYNVLFLSGRQYNIDQDGNIDQLIEATGIVSLNADKTTIEVGKTIQLMPTYEPENSVGLITYKSSNSKIATVSNTGVVTGVAEGHATITATVKEKEKSIEINVEPLQTANSVFDSSGATVGKMHVGDYVNYPVTYTNVDTWVNNTNGTIYGYTPKDEYVGWRVLSLEGTGENQYINLVSAGVPFNYYHKDNSDTSVQNLTTKLFETPINSSNPIEYSFYKCGFKQNKDDTSTLTTISEVKNIFNNKYTQVINETPQVQSMTKLELNKFYGEDVVQTSIPELPKNDLFSIPVKDTENNYAMVWLASAYNTTNLWKIRSDGLLDSSLGSWLNYEAGRMKNYYYYLIGVRLTVSLKANVIFSLSNQNTNGIQTWDLNLE